MTRAVSNLLFEEQILHMACNIQFNITIILEECRKGRGSSQDELPLEKPRKSIS
jgi:hypothetical protein